MLPEQISFGVLDALNYHQRSGEFEIPMRRFSAISLRLHTDAKYFFAGKSAVLTPPALCLIPEGISYKRKGGDEEVSVIRFHMLSWSPKEILLFPIKDVLYYQRLFGEAVALYEKKEAGYLFRLSAVLNEIFASVAPTAKAPASRKAYIDTALAYIKQNLSDTMLSVSMVAEQVAVSESQLRRGFHQALGISPKQYIDALRMERARALLETEYYTQAEVAERCGYADVDYFRTAFKQKNGMCIKKYKSIE